MKKIAEAMKKVKEWAASLKWKSLDAMKFKEANRCLTKPENMTDEECKSLWVFCDGQVCISCWKLNIVQRLRVLFVGHIWLGVLSGETQPQVWIDTKKTVFVKEEK